MFNNSASLRQLRQLMLLLLALFLAMGSTDGVGFNIPHPLREGKHKLCGQALNEAMDVVCVNGYNTIPKKRMDRNEASLELETETSEQTQLQQPHVVAGAAGGIDGYALSPLLSSIYGMEVLVKTRRQRRQGGGIYDECCRNSCTYPELLAYCRQ